jgi:hypothetical protein
MQTMLLAPEEAEPAGLANALRDDIQDGRNGSAMETPELWRNRRRFMTDLDSSVVIGFVNEV